MKNKCFKCERLLEQDEFYVSSPNQCKSCVIKRVQNYAKRTDYWKKRYSKIKDTPEHKLKQKMDGKKKVLRWHHVTDGWYREKLIEQNGVCAICNEINGFENGKRKLDIDHNHKTNKNRGLLCRNCNVAIGQLKENIEYLSNAIKYINKYKNKADKI